MSLQPHKSIFIPQIENGTGIEPKPLAAELVQTVYDSSENSNNFPSTSNDQSDRFHQQLVHSQRKQTPQHKCVICWHNFCSIDELDAHRQQECERLIEIDSNAAECKPTAVDFTESECDIETGEKQAIDDDNSLNVIDQQQSMNSKSIANQHEEKKLKPASTKKSSQNQKKNNTTEQQSDGKASRKLYPSETKLFNCPLCVSS